ncbi:MAG: tetratricopeptide repeat protein [Pirellula sp.]
MHPYRIIRSIVLWSGAANFSGRGKASSRGSRFVTLSVFHYLALLLAIGSWVGCASVREHGCDEILSVGSSTSEQSHVHYKKGLRLFDHGKLPAAAEAFERAIQLDYENGSAHNNLGLVYYQNRKWPQAAAEFEAATQLLPEDATPWNNLGMTMEATGKGYEAMEYYQHAYELAPRKPLYLGNLVRTRVRLGENDESVVEQLKELLFIESRPEWIEWINDQLSLKMNPLLDRGPPPPNLGSKSKSKSKVSAGVDRGNSSVVPIPQLPGELIIAEPIIP